MNTTLNTFAGLSGTILTIVLIIGVMSAVLYVFLPFVVFAINRRANEAVNLLMAMERLQIETTELNRKLNKTLTTISNNKALLK